MSKILSKQIKIEALNLYRKILKLHWLKLDEETRLFGDYFVKTEFTMNYKMADENQIQMFLSHWKKYYEDMSKLQSLSEIKTDGIESLKTKMDIDQKESLDQIRNLIKEK